MKPYYTIREAAALSGMTAETLRHYDRIGLIKPCKTDEYTGYRYYSDQEIAQLQVAGFFRQINFSLAEIKEIFACEDLESGLRAFRLAEEKVDEEILRLNQVKHHLQMTEHNYRTKPYVPPAAPLFGETRFETFPQRTIFLAPGLTDPTLSNLLVFHDTVEASLDSEQRPGFSFQNASGLLIRRKDSEEISGKASGETHCLFATCIKHAPHPLVSALPAGTYLCCYCTEEDRPGQIRALEQKARETCGSDTGLTVLNIIFTGIIRWIYEIQVYLGPACGDDI